MYTYEEENLFLKARRTTKLNANGTRVCIHKNLKDHGGRCENKLFLFLKFKRHT